MNTVASLVPRSLPVYWELVDWGRGYAAFSMAQLEQYSTYICTCTCMAYVVAGWGPLLEWRSPTQHPFWYTLPAQKGRPYVYNKTIQCFWKKGGNPFPPNVQHTQCPSNPLWSQVCTLPSNNPHWLIYAHESTPQIHLCTRSRRCFASSEEVLGLLIQLRGCSVQRLARFYCCQWFMVVQNKWYIKGTLRIHDVWHRQWTHSRKAVHNGRNGTTLEWNLTGWSSKYAMTIMHKASAQQ